MKTTLAFIIGLIGLISPIAPIPCHAQGWEDGNTIGPRSQTGWLIGGDVIPSLEDNFTTARAAGAVNDTPADGKTPSQIRTVVDTDTTPHLSISGGTLAIDGGKLNVNGDPGMWYPAQQRVAGKALFARVVNSTGGSPSCGWDVNQFGGISDGFLTASVIRAIVSGANIVVTGTVNYPYDVCLILRPSGMLYLYKAGSWKLAYLVSTGTTTPVYPGIAQYNTAMTISGFRVPKNMFNLPVLASDSFMGRSSMATTDGNGHTEANGGSGLAWNTTGTWSVGTNKAYSSTTSTNTALLLLNTPNVIVDAAFSRGAANAEFGVIMNADTPQNPQNYMGVTHDGNTTLRLFKVVAGVSNSIAVSTIAYSEGAVLRVVHDNDFNEYRAFYGNAAGPANTANNVSQIKNNQYFGVVTYSPYPSVTNFSAWPRGNENQFSALDTLK